MGVAISDGLGITAQPLTVVDRDEVDDRVPELVSEYSVSLIIVGLPVSLSGEEGPMARRARDFAAEVSDLTGVTVEMCDERFTTTEAERVLLEAGTRRDRRREVRDKVAAAVLLQGYLDAGR